MKSAVLLLAERALENKIVGLQAFEGTK